MRLSAFLPGRSALFLLCLVWIVGLLAYTPSSTQAQTFTTGRHLLKADYFDAETYVPPTPFVGKQQGVQTATINVTYIGFTPQAQQAFAFAVSIWETHISSPVLINVTARFEPLGENTLGATRPNLVAFQEGDGVEGQLALDTWYATALAEAILRESVNEGQSDFSISFNSDFTTFYFGTDGQTPRGMFDFATIVLHEIGHGLGFTSSFRVDTGEGQCPGFPEGTGCWGFRFGVESIPPPGLPFIYDLFLEDQNEVALLNTNEYPNPSRALGTVLQSNALFFDGFSVRSVNEDTPVDLFSPSDFEPGSSIAHLDESTFRPGNINSLMTPQLARAESIFTPGPITCGLFQDMGWPLGEGCITLLPPSILALEATLQGDDVALTVFANGAPPTGQVEIQRSLFEAPFETIRTISGADVPLGGQGLALLIDDLEPGRYTFRLRQIDAAGVVSFSVSVEVFIPLPGGFVLTGAHPNPFSQRTQLLLAVENAQNVRVEIFDVTGRRVAVLFDDFLPAESRERLTFEADNLPSGIYFAQIQGADFLETTSLVLVR